MSIPTFSVVMPLYNAELTVRKSIASVLDQTIKDWELIIVDDGSTDKSLEIVDLLSVNDPRIKVIRKKNSGAASSRNLGIMSCIADLIAFIDADDIWLPNKLARHLALHTQYSSPLISFARVQFVNSRNQSMGSLSRNILDEISIEHFLYENPSITPSNWVLDKKILSEDLSFNTSIMAEDHEFIIRNIAKGVPVKMIDEILVHYLISSTSSSANLKKKDKDYRGFYETCCQSSEIFRVLGYRRMHSVHLRNLARRALRLRVPRIIPIKYYMKSIASCPMVILYQPLRNFRIGLACCLYFFFPVSFVGRL